jgi:hypothetical protein
MFITFTANVYKSTPKSGVHTDAVDTSSGTPGPPIITAILDQPPGRAAYRLAPPGRLKRVLDKAHPHLGDLISDPLRVAHLRSRCELLRVVYEERLGARARTTLRRRCIGVLSRARARPLRPYAVARGVFHTAKIIERAVKRSRRHTKLHFLFLVTLQLHSSSVDTLSSILNG